MVLDKDIEILKVDLEFYVNLAHKEDIEKEKLVFKEAETKGVAVKDKNKVKEATVQNLR